MILGELAEMSKRNQRPTGAALRGMRSCIACRGRFQRESLARLVVAPDGQVLVDRYLRAPDVERTASDRGRLKDKGTSI